MKKRSERLILLVYIAAILIYALHTAVRCGLVVFSGSSEDFWADLRSRQLQLADYAAVRSDPAINQLYLLNVLRGILLLVLLYAASRLLPACVRILLEQAGRGEEEESAVARRSSNDSGDPIGDLLRADARRQAHLEHFDPFDDDRPQRTRQTAAPEAEDDTASLRSRVRSRRQNAQRDAQQTSPAQAEPEAPEAPDYFADLSPEKDNVRVIVKVTQRDEAGEILVQFFCGDTLNLKRLPVGSWLINTVIGGGEIRQFIRRTRRKKGDVFYTYSIREASQKPVVLKGEAEDAVRLIDRQIVLRIYREQMLFITPSLDIRTVDSPAQAPQSVIAVTGTNNRASRTRSYVQTFYQLDEGIAYEVEVRIKL